MNATSDSETDTRTVKPFLKWAGGKSQLLPQMRRHLPKELTSSEITNYIEPFLGGGAVFLDFAQRYSIRSAVLGDINPEIVLVYRVVQQSPYELIEQLEEAESTYLPLTHEQRKAYYYDLRQQYNQQRSAIDYSRYSDAWIRRSAFMIFLNKTCYNGLYRVNSQGGFNVPYGRYDKPAIFNAEGILRASRLLGIAEVRPQRFDVCRGGRRR